MRVRVWAGARVRVGVGVRGRVGRLYEAELCVVDVLHGEPSLRPQVRALLPPRARRFGSGLLLGVVLGA